MNWNVIVIQNLYYNRDTATLFHLAYPSPGHHRYFKYLWKKHGGLIYVGLLRVTELCGVYRAIPITYVQWTFSIP